MLPVSSSEKWLLLAFVIWLVIAACCCARSEDGQLGAQSTGTATISLTIAITARPNADGSTIETNLPSAEFSVKKESSENGQMILILVPSEK